MPASRDNNIRDGIFVGFVGYAAVALFYSAFDQLAARGALYTVDLLGRALFRGLRDPGVLLFPLERDAAAIFWYNALHLATALAIGLVVTGLVTRAERHPAQRIVIGVVIVSGFVVTVVAAGMLTSSMRAVLPWWSIVMANAFATIVAGSYLLVRRPGLWHRLVVVDATAR